MIDSLFNTLEQDMPAHIRRRYLEQLQKQMYLFTEEQHIRYQQLLTKAENVRPQNS